MSAFKDHVNARDLVMTETCHYDGFPCFYLSSVPVVLVRRNRVLEALPYMYIVFMWSGLEGLARHKVISLRPRRAASKQDGVGRLGELMAADWSRNIEESILYCGMGCGRLKLLFVSWRLSCVETNR